MLQPETQFARVGTDSVAYQVMGDGPRDIVHAIGFWSQVDMALEEVSHARFFRRLASFSRLIWFDCRGSGSSDPRPSDGRTFSDYWSEDLLAVLDAVGSRDPTIISVSDASLLTIAFVAAHPERCSALVLANGSARPAAAPDYPQGISADQLQRFEAFIRGTYGSDKWHDWWIPSLKDEQARQIIGKWLRSQASPRVVAENVRASMQMDVRHLLPNIKVPTLVMTRRNQKLLPPAHGHYIADHIPGARFVELPGADGMLAFEAADEILNLIEEFVTGRRHGGEPERALATVLFTDIVGSTERAAKLGDAAWRRLLDRHDQAVREQIGLFGGRLVESTGDGTLATFNSPDRAIDCALALHKLMAEMDLTLRAAVHFGQIELREDGRVGGIAVHIGARVLAEAEAGEVRVSHTVHDILIGSRYPFEERGVYELKGVPGKWRLFAL